MPVDIICKGSTWGRNIVSKICFSFILFVPCFFADVVAGGNLASVCTKIKKVVDKEQRKTVWVQSISGL